MEKSAVCIVTDEAIKIMKAEGVNFRDAINRARYNYHSEDLSFSDIQKEFNRRKEMKRKVNKIPTTTIKTPKEGSRTSNDSPKKESTQIPFPFLEEYFWSN